MEKDTVKKVEAEKTCFIIMPISTPSEYLVSYGKDSNHFHHVLECLFTPAVERAGFKPISPKASGADLIHAEIIKNLEVSDMVLCDSSTLNANVFLELGVRTSLNKPVCLVKDEQTSKIPFDTSGINHHEYSSALNAWELKSEITKLKEHIVASDQRCKGENQLWKHYGITKPASPTKQGGSTDELLQLLSRNVRDLKSQIGPRLNHWDIAVAGKSLRPSEGGFSISRIESNVPDTTQLTMEDVFHRHQLYPQRVEYFSEPGILRIGFSQKLMPGGKYVAALISELKARLEVDVEVVAYDRNLG